MKWKKFDEELPPIGKQLVTTSNDDDRLNICRFGYMFEHQTDQMIWPRVMTEERVREQIGYWLELPPLPKETR
jgi:hypothetical protein